jgi:cytochrome oxidase Cu insertion factor (SCO1/SenC/PrrC family)
MKLRRWAAVAGLALAGVAAAGCEQQNAAAVGKHKNEVNIPVAKLTSTAGGSATTQPDCCAIEPVAAAPSTQPATQPSARGVGARASEWLAPADRTAFDLDHDVTDQDGQMMKLADLRGYPLAVSFVFTRCGNAQMCPALAAAMRDLQLKLARESLAEKVRLALITLDPMYDTPPRLKEYAVNRGLTAEGSGGIGVLLLRPEPTQFARIMSELGVDISFTEEGEPNHKIELILIDREGRFVRDYQGAIWKTGVVMEDLKRLVSE